MSYLDVYTLPGKEHPVFSVNVLSIEIIIILALCTDGR